MPLIRLLALFALLLGANVAGANPDGSRSVTDKFVSLIDARDPTVQEEAAVLPLSDPNVVIVFTD